jgi:hypothetical protein
VGRQFQNVGVTALGGHRVALRQGDRRGSTGQCCREGAAHEIAATALGFAEDRAHAIGANEVFGCLDQASGRGLVSMHCRSMPSQWL